jgi:glutaconate CoA-transferase subunit B
VIGDYDSPKVRLPGAGGAPEIAAMARRVIVMLRQSSRSFVEKLDFRSSVGFGDGPGGREKLGMPGEGPTEVITDLGVLRPDPKSCELTLTQIHPGVTADQAREATGWKLQMADELERTKPPSEQELRTLRELRATLEVRA